MTHPLEPMWDILCAALPGFLLVSPAGVARMG